MRFKKLAACGVAVVLMTAAAACGSGSDNGGEGASGPQLAGTINGAGATFPEPVYQEWAAALKARGLTVNYQGIGSGGGISKITEGTVDFGATDAAMSDEELKTAAAKGRPLHIPTVFGAVAVAYNVAGLERGLKLNGEITAEIFLGKIKTWNDRKIALLNKGVNLPEKQITVCHRSDSSGTTKLLLTYLGAYSKAWKTGPGVDKSVDWPTGTGANGNDGLAGCIKQSDGAIGYLEQAYALQNDFATAAMMNSEGRFVIPEPQSTSAAGLGVKLPDDLRFDAINAAGSETYPIASATFIIVYRDMCKAGHSRAAAQNIQAWLNYGLDAGQQRASEMGYSPLPDTILRKAQDQVAAMECDGSPLSR